MKARTILSTALVSLTLLGTALPEASARAPARRVLPPRTICAAFGAFAYTRALERDAGQSYALTLEQTLRWDVAHEVPLSVRQHHQTIIAFVYRFRQDTPLAAQALVEEHCQETLGTRD